MYNVTAVQTAYRGLVGFRQIVDEGTMPLLPGPLIESRSGLWLDSAHALITARNLYEAAVQRPRNVQIDENTTNFLGDLLTQTLDDSVASVLSAIRTRKLLRLEGRTVLAQTLLFEGEGALIDIIQPRSRFVGLLIKTNDPNLSVTITRLGIQLTGLVTDLPIQVYTPNQNDPIATATVTTISANRTQWVTVNLVLSGATEYLIGYSEIDLPVGVQAVRWNRRIGEVKCAGCSPVNARLFERWRGQISVTGGRMDVQGIFDEYDSQNYGLNFAFSIGCDLTALLIAQQMQLAETIQQQAVVKLLQALAYTSNVTTVEQQTRNNAGYALNTTELPKLEKLLSALDVDLSGVSDKCLPDTLGPQKVKRGTVFNMS